MQTVFFLRRVRAFFAALDGRLARFRLLIGAALALLIAAGFALLSVCAGPLYNLNDIGSFANRAVFIVMASGCLALVLLLAAGLSGGSVYRLLLREVIVLAGFVILMGGINQKTYFYTQNIQPMIRRMDSVGLSAFAQWETNLSAPAGTLLYILTRGPVYDMYTVKLACVASLMVLGVLAMHAADRRGLGLRAEALLALCLIMPQGFMSAACTALPDGICLALLGGALALLLAQKDCPVMKWAAAVLYGLSVAMSGLALYALPVFAYLACKKRMTAAQLATAGLIPLAACVPAIACGMPAGDALASLFRANLALPEYAAGAPNWLSMIPRAAVEEMPEMFKLQHLAQIDAQTHAQPYYTQAHFEQAALGMTICGAGVYAAAAAWLWQKKDMGMTARVFAFTLCALLVCPGATNAAFIAAGVIALYAIMEDGALRLPACLVLFAISGAAAYPMVEETLLPMVLAFALCLCALLMTVGILPTKFSMEEKDD